jgi:hypothetical protein
MGAKANIILDQGATFTTSLVLADENDALIDLTDMTVQAQLRKWYTSSNSVNFTVSIPEPTSGTINMGLTANTTSSLDYGRYVYDIVTIDSHGTITRIIEGILTVTPKVTEVS